MGRRIKLASRLRVVPSQRSRTEFLKMCALCGGEAPNSSIERTAAGEPLRPLSYVRKTNQVLRWAMLLIMLGLVIIVAIVFLEHNNRVRRLRLGDQQTHGLAEYLKTLPPSERLPAALGG